MPYLLIITVYLLLGFHKPVFSTLDGNVELAADREFSSKSPEVRRLLERHPGVLTVFQGHQHQGQYNQVNNIHYYTLKAMVEGSGEENNSYAIVEIIDNLTVMISDYRKAGNKKLQSAG